MRRILFLLIFGLAGLGVLLSLGIWQVQRLSWKQEVLAEIEDRISADPVDLPAQVSEDADKYLPVIVSGEMVPGEIHVLVSVKQVGAGYRIIQSFNTGDRTILVDRGFVPTTAKDTERLTGPMEIAGNLHWPDEIDGYTPEADIDANIWFARDVQNLAAALGAEPVLLIARSQTDPNVAPLSVDTAGIPNDHLQYAITWFGLALVWAAMTGYFLWRSRANSESDAT
ncbi:MULTISPECIES: SURF1 family protein [unclassified Ruegeria]|uniref:SURF1 family protein n=1 Tax=unclassified Ruegeria TaxID=2625375 RepID=UPI001491AA23|nr:MULTISPECIES: SURF1 family protein [unclassified Ruegeria]NOD89555.1 SURF1 family protein [Ruegeria sp. HKCCD4318]NOE13878.1 SURF1 family protein [Ruegeria sp. HKCCD4318-2]NOG08186.1 SURF1 family protein [Ruegeria sp. HKCCD4315]